MKGLRIALYLFIGIGMSLLCRFAYEAGNHVGVRRTQCEAIEHRAGMYDLGGDGHWMWGDEIEKKYLGKHIPFFTPYRFPCQPDPSVTHRL